MLQVSVVVATYNRSQLLLSCLESLTAQKYPEYAYELIVIDDGSQDDTEETVRRFTETALGPRIIYKKVSHMGPAKARNVGIEESHGEIVAFIDDDAFASRDWLYRLLECFETHNAQAVEGAVLNPQDGILPFCHYTENRNGGQYLTANMAFKREIIRGVGMFDARFKYAHAEDKELACRVMKAGGRIVFCKNAVVYHPIRELTYAAAVEKWRMFGEFFKLYALHPEMFRMMTGRELPFFVLDTVFLIPLVDVKQWIGKLTSLRLRLKLLLFSFTKGLIRASQVLRNVYHLWEGNRKRGQLRSSTKRQTNSCRS